MIPDRNRRWTASHTGQGTACFRSTGFGQTYHLGESSVEIEKKLRELGYELPPPPAPAGNYVPAVRTGNLVFLSGQGPGIPGGGFLLRKCLKSDLFYQREKMVMAVTLTHESSKLSHRFD